jgi:hypothetical protein
VYCARPVVGRVTKSHMPQHPTIPAQLPTLSSILLSLFGVLLGAGLKMYNSPLLGFILIMIGIAGLWWALLPWTVQHVTVTRKWLLWLGWGGITFLGALWWFIAPPFPPTPTQAQQGGQPSPNQNMTNSPGGMQSGRDIIINPPPKPVPQYSGTLLFSPAGGGAVPILEIGDSGVIFVFTGLQGTRALDIFKKYPLTIESIGGRLQVSTEIKDKDGKPVATLTHNEWQAAHPPQSWDRNYTDDTLEVKDAWDHIVLQVRALPDRIQLQGEWWEKGEGFRLVKTVDPCSGKTGGLFVPLTKDNDHDEARIEPLFEYPSELHFGQLKPKP